MKTNLMISAVRSLSLALLFGLIFQSSGVSQLSSDGFTLPASIVINNTAFHLVEQNNLRDPRQGTQYRYRSSDSPPLDVFVFPVPEDRSSSALPLLDQEVASFLSTLDELKARGIYKSAYAELSREVYYHIANTAVSGRRVIVRMVSVKGELRSYFVIVRSGAIFIKFRYTVPARDFKELEFDEFVRAWLAAALNDSKDSPALLDPPHAIKEQDSTEDKESDYKRQTIRRELQGRVLGEFRDITNTISIDPEAMKDRDLHLAILFHELTHAAYPREEEQDREIKRIASIYGIDLRNEDYQVWGKPELAADLLTLEMLVELGDFSAIQQYVAVRSIRNEVAAPFLRQFSQNQTDKD
jgi:hypothetical protein